MISLILSLFNLVIYQDFFPSFDSMFSLFIIVFVIVTVMVILGFALNFWRIIKYGKTQADAYTQPAHPQAVEKEVIREIVKIRCQYCGNLYDEHEDKCPYCGGKN